MEINQILSQVPLDQRESPWLKAIVEVIQQQAERITALEALVKDLREENDHLKNLPKRPKFRPNRINPQKQVSKSSDATINSAVTPLSKMVPQKVKEEIVIPAVGVPEGSRFKGYASYTVQELEIIPKDLTYRLEIWQTLTGNLIRAELPSDVQGSHFGPQLRSFTHNLYALGMTEPGLFDLLRGVGIDLSEGQVHNLLMDASQEYQKTAEEILTAGLKAATYIQADDTGAKHQHKRGYCTHIGGEYFAYYKTTFSKSRANFLTILLQGQEGYWINEAFIWHLFQSGVEDAWLNCFEEYRGRKYRRKKGLNRLLNALGIRTKKLRKLCFEAGLIGFISESLLKPHQVLLSDRAGQFTILDHAICWVHMERPLRKLPTTTPEIEKEIEQVRGAIWTLYDKLKEASVTQANQAEVHRLYNQLIAMQSQSPGVKAVIASLAEHREELLKALDHPGLPLHNNGSEGALRSVVKRRNISGSTKSPAGKAFRDGLLTLQQTCSRLGVSFFGYLTSWFKRTSPNLAELVREKYQMVALEPAR